MGWSAWSPSGGSLPCPTSSRDPEQVSLLLAKEPELKAACEGWPVGLDVLILVYEVPSSSYFSLFHSSKQKVGLCARCLCVCDHADSKMLAMFLELSFLRSGSESQVGEGFLSTQRGLEKRGGGVMEQSIHSSGAGSTERP